MDEGLRRAVRTTFFNWFREGYIYRGKRLVNWDTSLQTSVADDETYTEDVPGGFWTFKYPVKEKGNPSPQPPPRSGEGEPASSPPLRFGEGGGGGGSFPKYIPLPTNPARTLLGA